MPWAPEIRWLQASLQAILRGRIMGTHSTRGLRREAPVHLDVYKRQVYMGLFEVSVVLIVGEVIGKMIIVSVQKKI